MAQTRPGRNDFKSRIIDLYFTSRARKYTLHGNRRSSDNDKHSGSRRSIAIQTSECHVADREDIGVELGLLRNQRGLDAEPRRRHENPIDPFAVLCSLLCGLAAHVAAQTAQLTGRITDANGAVVVGAVVAVTQVSTGVRREAVSNEEGYYTVPLLPPGE